MISAWPRTAQVSLKVRSFERIRIRISDLWGSFRANPFSDQWFIKSTLDKDLLDHWSARSEDGSLIQRVPLGEGSEINHFAQRCSISNEWVLHILTGKVVGNRSTNFAINTKCTRYCNVKSIGHWSQAFWVPKYPYYICKSTVGLHEADLGSRRPKQLTVVLDIRKWLQESETLKSGLILSK